MRWKTLSMGNVSSSDTAECGVCGGMIAPSGTAEAAFRPDFEHGDTPASLEFLEERHTIDISDERVIVCGVCRVRVDELLG